MDEIFIVGIDDAMRTAQAMVSSGYSVKIQLFMRTNEGQGWEDLIDKNIYSLIYEVITEEETNE
jgi:hypothetical protein